MNIGSIIKQLRCDKALLNSDICRGLCSVQSIVRFENSERFPDKLLADRLFGRLGKVTESYEIVIDDSDLYYNKLWNSIKNKMDNRKYDCVYKMLDEYVLPKKSAHLHEQLLIKTRADIYFEQKEYEKAYICYKKALEITEVDLETIVSLQAIDFVEMEMIFRQAQIMEFYNKNYKEALSIYLYLEKYLEINHISLVEICSMYCKLAERLAVAISIDGFIENGLEYLERAIRVARINRGIEELPNLIYIKCKLLEKIKESRGIDRGEQEELYRQLYVYYEFAIEFMEKKKVNIERYEEIKKILREKYEWEYID